MELRADATPEEFRQSVTNFLLEFRIDLSEKQALLDRYIRTVDTGISQMQNLSAMEMVPFTTELLADLTKLGQELTDQMRNRTLPCCLESP